MPSKRDLTSSLLATLASIPAPDPPVQNPLKLFSSNQDTKNIFLTLHVLFPNELLPALDILDRSLLQRLVLAPKDVPSAASHDSNTTAAPALARSESSGALINRRKRRMYLIRSTHAPTHSNHSTSSSSTARFHRHRRNLSGGSQYPSPSSRLRDHDDSAMNVDSDDDTSHSGEARVYVADPVAWSCTCPAFAFALFPAGRSGDGPGNEAAGVSGRGGQEGAADGRRGCGQGRTTMGGGVGAGEDHGQGRVRGGRGMEVGGLLRGDDVPLCKHLLACVLVEGCPLFSGCMVEREVGLEEMAGWGAGWGG